MQGIGEREKVNFGFILYIYVLLLSDSNQMNNVVQTSTLITQPYLTLGPITSPYEQQKPVKDLNKYATLKAVGKLCIMSNVNDEPTVFLFNILYEEDTIIWLTEHILHFVG